MDCLAFLGDAAFEPCAPEWYYLSTAGSCYQLYDNGKTRVIWKDAKDLCEHVVVTGADQTVTPKLPVISTEEELHQFDEVFSENYDEPWFGAEYNRQGSLICTILPFNFLWHWYHILKHSFHCSFHDLSVSYTQIFSFFTRIFTQLLLALHTIPKFFLSMHTICFLIKYVEKKVKWWDNTDMNLRKFWNTEEPKTELGLNLCMKSIKSTLDMTVAITLFAMAECHENHSFLCEYEGKTNFISWKLLVAYLILEFL